MSRFFLAFALATFALTATASSAGARLQGNVTDQSGGVLPGVSVVVTAHDGRVLGTAATDQVGAFAIDGLPALPVRVVFQLDGFSPSTADVELTTAASVQVRPRLTVAARTESVTVVAAAPPLPVPTAPDAVPLPAVPVLAPVPEHARESVCGPTKATTPAETFGTIRGKRFGSEHGLYFGGDQLTVDRGTADGLAVGQNYVAQRLFKPLRGSAATSAAHSAGLVQVVDVGEHDASVVIVYACDEVMRGDSLAAFRPETAVAPEPLGVPAFDDASRILFGDEGQLVGMTRRLMVIERGLDQGAHPGQRLTIFRKAKTGAAPIVVGDAVIISARGDSSTIRIEHASDAITFTDLVAPQRYSAGQR